MIKISHVSKIYRSDSLETVALTNVSFEIKKGEFTAIMGPSGSGKSTLMHILGGLDQPSSGEYLLNGKSVSRLSDDELAEIRNRKIGFIFQAYNLLPRTSALKNVMLPMIYADVSKEKRILRATELLKRVGLADRLDHLSNQLSGGEQQRVAIARGLAMDPLILLADEPTGNIASEQATEIMEIFQELNDDGHTIIMITHEADIAEYAKRVIYLRDGKIVEDHQNGKRRRVIKSRKIIKK